MNQPARKLAVASIAGLLAGFAISLAVLALSWPPRLGIPIYLIKASALSALLYLGPPLIVLGAFLIFRPHGNSLVASLAFTAGWCALVFSVWAWKPFLSAGVMPEWWAIARHLLTPLSICLGFSLVFGRTYGKVAP